MDDMQLDGIVLPRTDYDGCGKCVVAVRRLSRRKDDTASPSRQARQIIDVVDRIEAHIIAWADDWEVSGAINPTERPKLGPWLRDELGPYSGIVGADVSRIGRDVKDALNTGWMMKQSSRLLITANHGVWDLSDPAQENQFIAEAWGAQMTLRAAQKLSGDAAVNARASGVPHGMNSYGYRYVRLIPTASIDHVEVDPEAAKIIRTVAQRILDDESGTITVYTEAARLNRAGVLSPRDHRAVMYGRPPGGYLWSSYTLISILTSQAALGFLMHGKKPVLGPDGHPVRLADPLWDDATRDALIKKLVPKNSQEDRAPKGEHLLSGRAYCACGARLYVGRRSDGAVRYLCNGRVSGRPESAQCKPAPSMAAVKLEKIVTARFLDKWGDTPLLRRDFDPGTGHAARIAELERDRARLESDRMAGVYDRPADAERFRQNYARMGAEIDELSALPERPASMRWVPTGRRVSDQWQDADDDTERREILATYGIKIILYPNDGTRDDRVWVHDLDADTEAEARKAIAEYEAEQAAVHDDATWAIRATNGTVR